MYVTILIWISWKTISQTLVLFMFHPELIFLNHCPPPLSDGNILLHYYLCFPVPTFLLGQRTSTIQLRVFSKRNKVNSWYYRFNIHSLYFGKDPKVSGYKANLSFLRCGLLQVLQGWCEDWITELVRESSRGTMRYISTHFYCSLFIIMYFLYRGNHMLNSYSWIWRLTSSLEGSLTNSENLPYIKSYEYSKSLASNGSDQHITPL